MKRYSTPTMVLLALSALILVGVLRSFGRARRAAAELESQRNAVTLARLDLIRAQSTVTQAKRKNAPADHFLEKWSPEIEADANVEEVFGRLDTLAVNNLLSPSGKNFTLNKTYLFNGHHLLVQNLNITVAGDYARTLNWLGAAESAFPLARVEQISYTANGNSLSLAVEFVFPRTFAPE